MTNTDPIQPFYVPLTEILKDRGYTGDDHDVSARAFFLHNMYEKAQIHIDEKTLKNWFCEDSPKFKTFTRRKMHELCFVLEFNYDQARDFFDRIYLCRSFNCRNIREAVYCFCFSKGKNYTQASSLLKQAEKILEDAHKHSKASAPIRFTNAMEEDIIQLYSDREFLNYVADNWESFCEYNRTIMRELNVLINIIKGTKQDDALINLHRKTGANLSDSEYEKLQGLVVREYFLYHDILDLKRDLKGRRLSSTDFMLFQILNIPMSEYYNPETPGQSFAKNARLHELAKRNFPSKHTFSNILKKTEKTSQKTTTSFDGVRKLFILLHFYVYFVSEKVMKDRAHVPPTTYGGYVDDANDQLTICNYNPLSKRNPYDLLFLESAKTDQPLDTFREIISDAVYGDGE